MRPAVVAQERDLLVDQHLQHGIDLVAPELLYKEGGRVSREHVEHDDAHLGVVQPLTPHDDELINFALPCLEMISHLAKVLSPPRAVDRRVHLKPPGNSSRCQGHNNAAPTIEAVQLLRRVELVPAMASDVQVEERPQLGTRAHGIKANVFHV